MKGVKCTACGFVGWADQETCNKCGASLAPPPVQTSPPPAQSYVGQPQPPHPGYQPAYQHGPQAPTQDLKQGLARASLGIGALNFFTLGLLGFGAITGLTLGIVALSNARKRPNIYGGETLAIVGIAINGFWVLIAFPIVLAIALPNLLAARQAANESAAIHSLRAIGEAEVACYRDHHTYGTLEELLEAQLIKPELAAGTRYGYQFKVRVLGPGTSFEAIAVPVEWRNSGRRSFLLDETGVIRAADVHGREVSRSAPPLEDSRNSRSDDD